MTSSDKPDITAATKVGALLEAYPELEPVLISLSPSFAKLKNPVLRKTVAKVASLKAAADVAGIGVVEMVNALRAAAGLPALGSAPDTDADDQPPAWAASVTVVRTIDAGALIEAGDHPLAAAQKAAGVLQPGQALAIRSDFKPGPLIEHFRGQGFGATCSASEGGFLTLIAARPTPAKPDSGNVDSQP